jgi:hypothetical protein
MVVLGEVMARRVGGVRKGFALGLGRTDAAEGLVMRSGGFAPHERASRIGGLHV